ncbi:MAG: hypothetical protein AAFN77_09290 [Planctomycetota bacterium]
MKSIIKQVGPFKARMKPAANAVEYSALSNQQVMRRWIEQGNSRAAAEQFLMFSLGRLDVIPIQDATFCEAVKRHWDVSDADEQTAIMQIAERWQPFATVAAWYLTQVETE